MPDLRTNQAVGERLELRLERFPNPLHRRRRWFTLAGGVLPLLFVGYFVARRDHTIFWSQPVAASHQYFQADCQKCHHTPWQPLIRLASTDPAAKSVHDQACHQCHDQRKDDHHVLAMAKGVPDCADCHLEHRAAIRLTDQADATCVKCHQPFETHPQFALLRNWPLDQAPGAGAEATMEQLRQVAKLQPVGDSPAPTSGRWVDKTALKFSHQEHLAPLVAGWKHGTDQTIPAQPTQLTCTDCHQLDANGESMRPIVYESHCRDCHPLRFSSKLERGFSSKLERAAAPDPHDQGHNLPHATPEIVRSVMRERLIAYARRHPEEILSPTSRLPNRQQPRTPTPRQEWEWVEQEQRFLEDAIFRLPKPDGTAHPSNACLKCHESGAATGVTSPGFVIVPPRIPTRWMPHSQFRHDRHLEMQCVACHQATTAEPAVAPGLSATQTLGSTNVQDILMPPKETCQVCHGATSGPPEVFRRARSNCTECHQYHHIHFTKAANERAPR